MIQIALSGDTGKMGLSLKKLIKSSRIFQLNAIANRTSPLKNWNPKNISLVLDFSLPNLFIKSLTWSIKHKKAFVSGTTGLTARHKQALKTASKSIPVFYAANMSGGIFLITKYLNQLKQTDVKIIITDIHHKNKKDKPSGTALKLQSSLSKHLKKTSQIKSIRTGKHFGTHKIQIKNKEEIIILEHHALNRELFAKGALKACVFLSKKQKGYYDLEDLFT